jgi:hypothetical protein
MTDQIKTTRRGRQWTKRDYEVITRLWLHQGWSMNQIAMQFGVTRNSIISCVRKMDLIGMGHDKRSFKHNKNQEIAL